MPVGSQDKSFWSRGLSGEIVGRSSKTQLVLINSLWTAALDEPPARAKVALSFAVISLPSKTRGFYLGLMELI